MSCVRVVGLLAAGLLGGCALSWNTPPPAAPAAPAPEPAPERVVGANDHLVRSGDTVYSIAFRNNLDYRDLAKWNRIGSTYLIHPGQVLRLSLPPPTEVANGWITARPTELEESPAARPMALPVEPLDMPAHEVRPLPPTAGKRPNAAKRPQPIPLPPVVPPPPPPASQVALASPPAAPLTSESGAAYRWQWPVEGVVVRGFNPGGGSKGLDFTGDIGQPVYAAAPGRVVYSGSALKGYGELIIIKHDDLRLSAYGYNRRRLVEEGAMVAGGQSIAELGLGPENKPILHFEIRERGQPVNPVPYLPAK